MEYELQNIIISNVLVTFKKGGHKMTPLGPWRVKKLIARHPSCLY